MKKLFIFNFIFIFIIIFNHRQNQLFFKIFFFFIAIILASTLVPKLVYLINIEKKLILLHYYIYETLHQLIL